MFNNPIKKYQSGGKATPQQEQQIAQLFEAASKNTGIDVETLMNAANQMPDENSIKQYVQAISMAAQGDQNAISSIKKMFSQKPAMQKLGGKIRDFICKHAKGGQIADCGCDKKVTKGEDGLPAIGDHSPRPASINVPTIPGLIAEFRQHKVADSGNATNRNFSKVNWRGNQYFLERANIDGNTADTWIQVTPKLDTLVEQTLPSGRVAPLTIEQAQSIVNRNRADINNKEKGGVVKGQGGIPEGLPEIPAENEIYSEKHTMVKGPSIRQRGLGVRRPWLAQTISFNPFSARNDTTYTGRDLQGFIPGYSDDLLKIRYSALPSAVKKNLAKVIDSDYEEYNSTRGSYPNNYYEKTITVKKRNN